MQFAKNSNRQNTTSGRKEEKWVKEKRDKNFILIDSKSRMIKHLTKTPTPTPFGAYQKCTMRWFQWFFNHKFRSKIQLLHDYFQVILFRKIKFQNCQPCPIWTISIINQTLK